MRDHQTEAHEERLAARLKLLKEEKELTQRSDEVAQRRQQKARTGVRVCRDGGGFTMNPVTLVTPTFRRPVAKLSHDQQRAIGSERHRVPARRHERSL